MACFPRNILSLRTFTTSVISLALTACISLGAGFPNNDSASILSESQIFDPVSYDKTQEAINFTPPTKQETFKVGDVATITVNGLKEFSGIYTVGNDGKIYFGHIGDVYVAGSTVPEVQFKLRQEYNNCCLVNPNVSVEREGQDFGKIVVDGAVNDAGVFDITNVIKLSEAVALAGGISEIAAPEMTVLSRQINGERRVSTVDLKSIQLYGANDPLIYPNDVIYIQDSRGRLLYKDFVKTLPLISAVILATTR